MSAGSQGLKKEEKERKETDLDSHSQFVTKNQNFFPKVKISFLIIYTKIKDFVIWSPSSTYSSVLPWRQLAKSLQSCPTLCDPIDAAHQAPPSLGFSRQEHWSGLPFPSPIEGSLVTVCSTSILCWLQLIASPLNSYCERMIGLRISILSKPIMPIPL